SPKCSTGSLSTGTRQAFVQHYDTDVLDSALLRMPMVGFIAPRDPQWLATLDAMNEELVTDSLVYRYDPGASPTDCAARRGPVLAGKRPHLGGASRRGHTPPPS